MFAFGEADRSEPWLAASFPWGFRQISGRCESRQTGLFVNLLNSVSDGAVALQSALVHSSQHRNFSVHVVVNSDNPLVVMKPM